MEHDSAERPSPGRRLKILVAIDASEVSDLVVQRSGQFFSLAHCDLTVVTVIEDAVHYEEIPDTPIFQERRQQAEEILAKAAAAIKELGAECKTMLAVGPIAGEIVRIASEGSFDIIFIGSRGLGGLKRLLLGSVAYDVLRHAQCAVTLVR